MFHKYSTILLVTAYSLVLSSHAGISAQQHPTIQLGFVTDASSNTNWTEIFHDALKLHDKLPQKVKFEFVAVFKTDVNSFGDILHSLCHELLPRKVQAIFLAAEDSMAYEFTKLLAGFPHLILGTNRDPVFENQEVYHNYRYLQPTITHQSKTIQAILNSMRVIKYSIMYEMHTGYEKLAFDIISLDTNRISNVFEAPISSKENCNDDDDTTFVVQITEVLTKIKIQEIKVIVLACGEQLVETVFETAIKLGMVSGDFVWIGTEAVVQALNVTTHRQQRITTGISNFIGVKLNMSEETIALKALQILASSIQVDSNDLMPVVSPPNGSCYGVHRWTSLKKLTSHCGQTTQNFTLNQQVFSDNYEILKLETNSVLRQFWSKIATYQNTGSFQLEENLFPKFTHKPGVASKNLLIVGIEHGQYLYKVGNVISCTEHGEYCTREKLRRDSLQPNCEIGVPCYEYSNISSNSSSQLHVFCVSGLMIDLLDLIQSKLSFSYELYLVPDGKYGAIDDATGLWNGMIGEVLYGKADMALGTITINAQRSKVVDFTTPYGEVGIGMVIANGVSAKPLITMEFLAPFGTSLWFAILLSILTMFLALWFLDRKTSNFYINNNSFFSKRAITESLKLNDKGSITLLESMSFTWSTLVHVSAGSGFPRSLSARLVAIFFAFAMIILSSTYTANLAANKVKDDAEPPVTGIYDEKMINPPPGFHFGTLKSSSTEAYFKFNRDPRMRKIYDNMKDYNVENVHDGVEKVKSGEFSVYIDDHPYLEHMVSSQHDCSLRIVGESFGISGYGLVLAKDSTWTQAFSSRILQLNDENALSVLWNKWLVRKCLKKEDFERAPHRLSMYDYNGVFVLVAAGIFVSILFVGIERKIASYQARRKIIAEASERSEDHTFSSTTPRENSDMQSTVMDGSSLRSFIPSATYSNSELQLERCDDHQQQEINRFKFNSVC